MVEIKVNEQASKREEEDEKVYHDINDLFRFASALGSRFSYSLS